MTFLVQIDDTPMFLTELRSGKPFGTSYPTQAIQMSFDAANEIVERLRRQGYVAASVTDRFGQPPSVADLASVKQTVQYIVTFHNRYFCGQNAQNLDLGSTDRDTAVEMSQGAALVVVKRLKRMGFKDAVAIESSGKIANPNVQEELKRIWPAEFSATK